MPRGSNTEAEYSRVKSRSNSPERGIKSGTGPDATGIKKGFGRDSMQRNRDSKRKTGF